MTIINNIFQIINNIHLFRIISLIINITYVVPSSLDIENLPMKIVFGWGIYLIAKDIFNERVLFKSKYWYLLLALAISFAVSVITNYPYQFPVTVYNWIYLVQAIFILYPFNTNKNFEHTNKWVIRFNNVLIIYVFILTILSLITFVFNIQYWAMSGTGFWQRQGFMENRLFGLYSSPNVGSILGVLSVVASLVNNLLKSKKWYEFNNLYKFNLIAQYLYFILSSSRGTTIVILAITVSLFVYGFIYILRNKNKIEMKIGRYVLYGLLSFFLVSSINASVKHGLAYVPSSVQMVYTVVTSIPDYIKSGFTTNDNQLEIPNSIMPTVTIQHSDDSAEFSSGRFTIWKAALEATKQKPLFGLADSDLYRNMQTYEMTSQVDLAELSQADRSELRRSVGNMHSTYISAIIHSGIVGTTLLFLFALLYLINHFKIIFKKSYDLTNPINQIQVLLLATLISMLVLDIVENHVLYKPRDPMGLIFWVYAGYLNFLSYKINKKERLDVN